MDLTGKRALVTGGGRGIGAAVAQSLAEHGAEVIICGRAWTHLDAVANAIGATAMVCDLRDRSATNQLVATLAARGRIDILVNNAGIAESAPLADHDDAMWDRIMELDATAPFRLTRALVPPMVAAGWGRVITIASNAGLTGYGYSTAYCAAKHAVIGMTRALAVELGRTGVTINAVCPGWVDTDMAAEAATRIAGKTGRDLDAARAALTGMTPQRRLIAPAEVAHAVAMLCSDDARGIHGQALVVDGGQVLK